MSALPVAVTLVAPVFDALTAGDGDALTRQRVEDELSGLASDCGVAVRPEVSLSPAPDAFRGQPFRVHVDGRLCLVPAGKSAEALAYAVHSPAVRPSMRAEDLLYDAVRPDEKRQALALAVRAAVSARPEVLVAPDDPLAELLATGVSLASEDPAALRDAVRSGGGEDVIDRLAAPTFNLHIEPEYLRALTASRDAAELFSFVRDGLLVELGIVLPSMHVRLDESLPARGYAFRVNAIRSLPHIGLDLDSIFVNEVPERLRIEFGVAGVASTNPATGQPGAIVPEVSREPLEAAGFTTWDAFGYYILTLAEVVRTQAGQLMTPAQVRTAVNELSRAFPAVTGAFDDAEIREVVGPLLRSLLAEQISVRNLRHILQLIRRHAVAPEITFGLDRASFVRRGLADQIANAASRGSTTLVVYLVDPTFERELTDCGEAVPVELAEELRDGFHAELMTRQPGVSIPPVLTADQCRPQVRDILRGEYPSVRVLGFQDLPGHYNVQPAARISRNSNHPTAWRPDPTPTD
jgi:hypothetical protein